MMGVGDYTLCTQCSYIAGHPMLLFMHMCMMLPNLSIMYMYNVMYNDVHVATHVSSFEFIGASLL